MCKFCNKKLKRPCALAIHERTCKLNPNRRPLENHVNGFAEYNNRRKKNKQKTIKNEKKISGHYIIVNGQKKLIGSAWNKGKTKETDSRLAKSGRTLSAGYKSGILVNFNKGKHRTEAEKKHLSEVRKQYLKEHPEKVPYVLNHHSKGDSYPEKYFKSIFANEKIEYEQNFKAEGYFLDFAWPLQKTYIEVDGEQHYVDNRIIEHDKVRTQKLAFAGWKLIERIRWSKYQKLNEIQRKDFLQNLFRKLK